MSGISKRVNGSWVSGDYGIIKTATDTIATLPANIYPNAVTATVGLKGQMVQSSTPSPTTPIQPQEFGDLETTGEHSGQYKIPISSANTTTPVYLGEVETTRIISKYEFTGQEEWARTTSNVFRTGISGYLRQSDNTPVCTHYKGQSTVSATSELEDFACAFLLSSSGNNYFYIRDLNFDAYADFKAYLAQQYAAGTPVCVWYVLATETTGIVNEPLRKIGDYADTVSGITIPTIAGADSFDVLTTLKPSEVSLTYTGWHDATVKEWDGSEWQ